MNRLLTVVATGSLLFWPGMSVIAESYRKLLIRNIDDTMLSGLTYSCRSFAAICCVASFSISESCFFTVSFSAPFGLNTK